MKSRIQVFSPYWYFTFKDPDGNPIEVTGGYSDGEDIQQVEEEYMARLKAKAKTGKLMLDE